MTKQELAELDMAVAKAIQKLNPEEYADRIFYIKDKQCLEAEPFGIYEPICWDPSTNWSQGGPIIEEYEIGLDPTRRCKEGEEWLARINHQPNAPFGIGPTPLIAAMKAFVASKGG